MSNEFRLAIIGAGMITQGSHLPAALGSRRVTVSAIVDPAVERAKGLARAYGIKPWIASRVEEVLGKIDGAIIATPNGSHKAIAEMCLEADVSTLIEKPIAVTSAEGESIGRLARQRGKIAAVGYSTRFRESTLLLKELLDKEYFGKILRFAHQFGTAGGWAPLSAYNLDRKSAGGGVLMVTATHFLDRMLHFWGQPDDVEFEDDSEGGPEANCKALVRYGRGNKFFSGVAVYSKTCRLPGGMLIETERGTVRLADSDDAEISFLAKDGFGVEQIIRRAGGPVTPPGASMFQLQIEDFVEACESGRKPMVDSREGTESLRLIERLYAARVPMLEDWRPTRAAGEAQ